MGTRCECTGKMVSLETGEPEEQNANFEEDGSITIEVRLTRNCAECGEEKKETTFTLDADVSEEIEKHIKEHHEGKKAPSFTMDRVDYESTESGGGRYAKNLIGVTASYTIRCEECVGTTAVVCEGDISDSSAASGFDEL